MESLLSDKWEVKPKHASKEELERWRDLCMLVKNPKRRFRFTASLGSVAMRQEAAAMRKTNQDKLRIAVFEVFAFIGQLVQENLRIAVLVSKAAFQFIIGCAEVFTFNGQLVQEKLRIAVLVSKAAFQFIIGCAEVFTFIGQLEVFYERAPDAMRSLCSALSLTTVAFGNYLSTLLVNIVTYISTRDGAPGCIPDSLNYCKLHYFFWLLAVLSVINLGFYLLVTKWYRYKKALGPSNDETP